MNMTDEDGRPIAVQPQAKPQTRSLSPKDFNSRATPQQQAMEVDYDEGGDYTYSSDGYAQSPVDWRNRYPSNYQVPSTPAPQKSAASAQQSKSNTPPQTSGRKPIYPGSMPDILQQIMGDIGNNTSAPSSTPSAAAQTQSQQSSGQQRSLPSNMRVPGYTAFPNKYSDSANLYDQEPSPSIAVRPGYSSVVRDTQRTAPQQSKQSEEQTQPTSEDYSSFWRKRLSGGDVKSYMRDTDLMDMVKQNKRKNSFGPEIPFDKQPIEYRAAVAELMRRGKL
jgi:hypothetical protein